MKTTEDDPLLTTAQAAALCGMREGALVDWRSRRRGPRYIKVGASVRYRRSDVLAWLEANTVTPAESAA
jgi:predicted DNA-binding transcriptional regulator AlpA